MGAFIDPFPAKLGAAQVDPPDPAKMAKVAKQYFGPRAKPCTQNMLARFTIHEKIMGNPLDSLVENLVYSLGLKYPPPKINL